MARRFPTIHLGKSYAGLGIVHAGVAFVAPFRFPEEKAQAKAWERCVMFARVEPSKSQIAGRAAPSWTSRANKSRGLTLLEVLIASVILSVAGMAALELLARSDAASLFSRRQALASVEAERILGEAAEQVKSQHSATRRGELDAGTSAEALGGCTATVSEAREVMSVGNTGAAAMRVAVTRITAEIRDPSGNLLVAIERVVPTAAAEEAR